MRPRRRLAAVIDQTKIVELPLNGRDYNQLALLSPGVLAPTPRLQSIGFKGVSNVNGNRAFNNAFQLDGMDNTSYSNSFRGLNVQIVQPSIEALQEFKIQTNAYQGHRPCLPAPGRDSRGIRRISRVNLETVSRKAQDPFQRTSYPAATLIPGSFPFFQTFQQRLY